jgi:cellulose synthase (UDP-forming)
MKHENNSQQKNNISSRKAGRSDFLKAEVSKGLLIVNIAIALIYFGVISFMFERSRLYLFALLMIGQVFFLWQVLTFIYTVWDTKSRIRLNPYVGRKKKTDSAPPVDVFITVCGEPVELVEETALAAKAMDYPRFNVYLLNDGYVAGKDNWRQIEELATQIGVKCITRKNKGGAKAGNINHALKRTASPYVAIFDADHVPHPSFLKEVMPFFKDRKMGFVQTPQYYKNYETNEVTKGSWEQQQLFFGPICRGKDRLNATTMCGTNMVISREAFLDVGGMCEESIAEDFVTGMFMHEKGWNSAYLPKVLAEGLAPEDFLSYYKQQYRWARGALDVIFKYRLFFRRGLTFAQKVQYLSSVSFFVSGVVIVINAMFPIIFFITGLIPFYTSTMVLAAVFLPYIVITIYTLQSACNFSFTFRSLAFSMAGFTIHLKALMSALGGEKSTFSVTSKKQINGNFPLLVIPQLAYIGLAIFAFSFAVFREGLSPSVMTNLAWTVLNVAIFSEFIIAALPEVRALDFARSTSRRTPALSTQTNT